MARQAEIDAIVAASEPIFVFNDDLLRRVTESAKDAEVVPPAPVRAVTPEAKEEPEAVSVSPPPTAVVPPPPLPPKGKGRARGHISSDEEGEDFGTARPPPPPPEAKSDGDDVTAPSLEEAKRALAQAILADKVCVRMCACSCACVCVRVCLMAEFPIAVCGVSPACSRWALHCLTTLCRFCPHSPGCPWVHPWTLAPLFPPSCLGGQHSTRTHKPPWRHTCSGCGRVCRSPCSRRNSGARPVARRSYSCSLCRCLGKALMQSRPISPPHGYAASIVSLTATISCCGWCACACVHVCVRVFMFECVFV